MEAALLIQVVENIVLAGWEGSGEEGESSTTTERVPLQRNRS